MNDELGGESETPWMSLKIFPKKNQAGLSLETQLQPFPRKPQVLQDLTDCRETWRWRSTSKGLGKSAQAAVRVSRTCTGEYPDKQSRCAAA